MRRLFSLRKEGNSDTCRTIGEPLYDCSYAVPQVRKEGGLPRAREWGIGVVVKGLQLEEMKMF